MNDEIKNWLNEYFAECFCYNTLEEAEAVTAHFLKRLEESGLSIEGVPVTPN